MNPNSLNKWLTLVANTGVIIGIAFLAYEIRQSNRIAIASMEIAVGENYAAANESIYENPAFAEFLFKARNPDTKFEGPEFESADAYVARQMNNWKAIEQAYLNGMVSLSTLETAKEDIKWAIDTYPAFRPFFRLSLETYGSTSDSQVGRTIAQNLEHYEQ